MRLTVIGGGGFRVPLIYEALLRRDRIGIDEVVLFDIDPARLAVIRAVLQELDERVDVAPSVYSTTDVTEAVRGAAFVFSAIRVGGTAGRVLDERVALAHGQLGQETTGAGGVAYGLRSVPEMVRIASAVAEHAGDAWTINFTNPVGMVTEAMSAVLGDRVIGICDSPIGLCRRIARILGVDPRLMWFDYFGLNHLGWLRAAYLHGRDTLPELLKRGPEVESIEEGALFGSSWLQSLGMVPNEYLHYFYNNEEAVQALHASEQTRGEYLDEQQRDFYARVSSDSSEALAAWRAARADREASYMSEAREQVGFGERHSHDLSGGYEDVALDVMEAIALNAQTVQILNVRNRSAVPALDADAIVEVPCVVGSNGAMPLAVGQIPEHAAGLMLSIKSVERDTIAAALTGDRGRALRALGLHPLVRSVGIASALLDDYEGGVSPTRDLTNAVRRPSDRGKRDA